MSLHVLVFSGSLPFIIFHSSSKIDINISSAYLSPSITASLKTPSLLKPAFKYTFSALGLKEYTSNSKRCRCNFSKAKSRVTSVAQVPIPFPLPVRSYDQKAFFLTYDICIHAALPSIINLYLIPVKNQTRTMLLTKKKTLPSDKQQQKQSLHFPACTLPFDMDVFQFPVVLPSHLIFFLP